MDLEPTRHMIPVWFFIGILLAVYGVLILITGIREFRHPPPTALANLHPAVWWGALLIAIGGTYIYAYRPTRRLR